MDKKGNKKLSKKLIIIVFASITALLLTLYFVIALGERIYQSTQQQRSTEKHEDIVLDVEFYPVEYDKNIFDDQEYCNLIADGIIVYDDGGTRINYFLDDPSVGSISADCIFNMVKSVVYGNADEYNSFFSQEYFKAHTKKENFTMQKIYDCNLQIRSKEDVSENGNNYTKYVFTLSYCIYENNGSFRKDIFDETKKLEYVTVSDKNSEGKYLIDCIE